MKYLFTFLLFSSLLFSQSFQSVVHRLRLAPVEKRQQIIEPYLNAQKTLPVIEQDSLVHFILYGNVGSVQVNSNLQHWLSPEPLERIPCGPYSLFFRTDTIPSDARLDYKFIIDGKETLDPRNPFIVPSGYGPHSELRMPKFTPSPYLAIRPGVHRGLIDSLIPRTEFPPPLRRYARIMRPIKVYRPPGYDTLSALPVVYVHDGFEAIDYAFIPRIIDNLIAVGKIPPVMAVFIPPADRGSEYMGGAQEQFVRFQADELVPLIDRLYRTDRSPQKRAVIGISSGAHIALITALMRPDVFQNVGGQSSTISSWLKRLTRRQARLHLLPPEMKFYLDVGRYDIKSEEPIHGYTEFLIMNREYSGLLSTLRIPHYYREYNDGHEWAGWRERIPDMLIHFFWDK